MRFLQNLHTHSTYCDGMDTPEEMVRYAIEKGFDSIGFSGHSYMFYAPTHSMSREGNEEYKKEINLLKGKCEKDIKIYLGLELDMYSQIDLSGYDYCGLPCLHDGLRGLERNVYIRSYSG